MDHRMTILGRIFPAGIAIVCLGFGLWFQACDNVGSRSGGDKETAMARSMPSGVKPPIDAAAPAKTETAAFALG
jgi:hypothetical protein